MRDDDIDRAKAVSIADPLEVFIARAEARASLWREGDLDLHVAVDVLQDAARQTGLVDTLGQDAVQAVMVGVFAVSADPPADDDVPHAAPTIRAAASTVDALMFSLCQRGAAALTEPACQSRLAELSTAQIRDAIERLIVARPHFRAIDDERLFLIGEQL